MPWPLFFLLTLALLGFSMLPCASSVPVQYQSGCCSTTSFLLSCLCTLWRYVLDSRLFYNRTIAQREWTMKPPSLITQCWGFEGVSGKPPKKPIRNQIICAFSSMYHRRSGAFFGLLPIWNRFFCFCINMAPSLTSLSLSLWIKYFVFCCFTGSWFLSRV